MAIHEAVKAARIARELSVPQVAERANVHSTHLIHFEAGRKWMSRAKLERVLEVVGLKLVDLNQQSASSTSFEDAATELA